MPNSETQTTDDHDMHEKYDMLSLKTHIRAYANGEITISSTPSGDGYAKAHSVSGGDRIELFAIKKGSDGKTRFWMNMEPEDAKAYANQILREVARVERENNE